MLVFLYPILSLVLLLFFKRKVYAWYFARPFAYILFIMCIFCPIFYYHPQFKYSTHAGIVTILPILYWFCILLIVLYPLKGINLNKLKIIKIPTDRLIILAWFLVFISTVSSLIYLPFISNGFNFANFELNKYLYQSGEISFTNNRALLSILNLHSTIRSLISFTFFYCIAYLPHQKTLKIALGLSSTIPILFMTFAKCVRVDTAFLTIQFFILYMIFKPFLTKKTNNMIKNIGLGVILGTALLMIFFSVQRFNNPQWKWDPAFYIYSYISESILNFNTILYDKLNILTYGDESFPLIRKYLGLHFAESGASFKDQYKHLFKFPTWFFYNFIGDIMRDFGKFGSVLFFISFSYVLRKTIFNPFKHSISFIRFFLIFLYVDFITTGLFYNRYNTYFGNLTLYNLLLICLFTHLYFRLNKKFNI